MLITGFTAEHMQTLADENVVGGAIDSAGHLILETRDGTQIDAGYFGLSAQTISVATDFRTLTTPGTYLFPSSATVAASANLPTASGYGFTTGQAGFLLVEGNGGSFVKQTWTNYNAPNMTLIQTRYSGTTWYPWATPVQYASQTRAGLLEIATAAEVAAQSDDTKSVSALGLASMLGYRYLTTAIYTSSGSFAKASYAGIKAVRIQVIGGGGGGGGANAATANNHSCAGGGGGGGYAESFVLASALATSETLTVGAGGSAGSNGNGGTGGTSSFGTHAVAAGGIGGEIVTNTPLFLSAPGGNGGAGTAGTLRISGGPGENGAGYATIGIGGNGGPSQMGPGGLGQYNAASAPIEGLPGGLYGGGGSGSSANQNSVNGGSSLPGGAGGKGIIIVEVYV
ncbi:hypothetical protein PBI_INGRID_23 [Arthrobacter phage Ingrid]|nr:hypothetical protein PBI_INGRID_23 [Arthrobacter phage Ingrid]QFG11005.1 hypothetical protein PBI_LORETTA_23 [Arthrobacter phage Loretta]